MRRLLVLLLATIVLAGFAGTLIARDPGYVLVTWNGYSMQTSLWVLLGLVLFFTVLVAALLRIYRAVMGSPAVLRGWRELRREARAERLYEKGQGLLAEGEATRARKFLEGAAKNTDATGVHYLAAARAADASGDGEARETYLRLAEETDPALARARSVVAAELALDRNEPDVALAALGNVKTNLRIAKLRQRALQQKNDWRELLSSVDEFRQLDPVEAAAQEKDAVLRGFLEEAANDDQLSSIFRALSQDLKHDPDVIVAYAQALADRADIEPLIRSSIKQSFNAALVEQYGELDGASLKNRRKTAEGWLKKYPDEPAVHYCLGCIYELLGEPGMARDAFSRSVELGGSPSAHQRLGLLLAQDGQHERSSEQFRLALLANDRLLP